METEHISYTKVLEKIFSSSETKVSNNVIYGKGHIKNTDFHILGTIENTMFGVDESLEMAKHVLSLISPTKTPLFLLVDVAGQKLSVRDEWLGMYAYFAHLLKCLHLARKNGHRIISLIYNQAIGGSFIAFGMMADRIYALPHAKLAVMWLEGMAKVTKIDIETLQRISQTSPVFAPGVENFKKLGGLHEVLPLEAVPPQLLQVLQEENLQLDKRALLGKQFGGRKRAYDIISLIENL